jgi:hypothetical protein
VDAAPQPLPYRRIGTILVEKRLISERQLELGLVEQRETGRPLGEICVDRFGLDRLSLADALAEQWEEMQGVQSALDVSAGGSDDPAATETAGQEAEDELRALLDEAQAARVELAVKTEELGRRLAALEVLVVGVTDALTELRDAHRGNGHTAEPRGRRSRARTGRPAGPQAATS